jgi:hypothetical protein
VERRVGIGFVRPWTVRPVSGVWARVDSRPVPPAFRAFVRLVEAGRLADRLFFADFLADFLDAFAERAEVRFFGALPRRDGAFFRVGAAFFLTGPFLPRVAFRAAFFAIVGLLSPA